MTADPAVTPLSAEQVSVLGDALLARAEEETSEWEHVLETRIFQPLTTAAGSAALAHEKARMALLEPDVITWRGAVAYRDAVDRILAALLQTMEQIRPADQIGTSLAGLRRSLREATAEHPGVLAACDPPEFYDPAPEDPPRVLWLKRWVRLRRRVGAVAGGVKRLLGQSPEEECRRDIAIRSFWQAHVDDRLGSRHYLRHEELQLLWARPWFHLLRAATTAVEAVLLIDQSHDAPGLHFPTGTAGALEEASIPDDESAGLKEAVAEFHQALLGLARVEPSSITATTEAAEIFRRSLALAGTPLLPRIWHPRDRAPVWPERLGNRGAEWDQWSSRANTELRALVSRVRFRRDLMDLQDRLLATIHRQTVEPLVDRVDRMGRRLGEVGDGLSELPAEGVEAMQREFRQAMAGVEVTTEQLIDLAGVGRAEQALDNLGASEQRRIDSLIDQLPDEVAPVSAGEEREVDPRLLPVPWSPREAAREAFQPPLPVLLGDAVPGFRDRVIQAWATVHQVPHIVEYAMDAAGEVLQADTDDSAPGAPGARALTVARDGLTRATDTMARAVEGLQPGWQHLAETVWKAMHADWIDFQRRGRRAMDLQRAWHGMGAAASLAIRRRWYRLRHAARHWWQDLQPRLAALAERIRQLLSRGQAAVGVARPTESHWQCTMDALDEVVEHRATFPLVYRRLFGEAPLERRRLLAGRDAPLDLVRDHVARWERGDPAGSLLIEALPGVGRTSFLAVMAEETETPPVRWLALTERMTREASLVAVLAPALDHPAASTLDELETALRSGAPRSGGIVIVDDIEHLFLHLPGGAGLMEAFLGFCTRTDSHVHWILSINGVAGPVIRAELPAALRAFRHVRLDPLGREDLELALLTRHEWSGLALQVLPPEHPGFFLRRRLARTRTAEARARLLRSLYIDRLMRAAGGEIGQALLYWIRSATFEAAGGEGQGGQVTLRPVDKLDYRFLGSLPLVSTMTLRALLMHATLTVAEHAAIFRFSEEQARQTLEHLLAQRLLQPRLPEGATDPARTEAGVRVVPGVAYGVHPAMRHAVLERLGATNLLPRGTS